MERTRILCQATPRLAVAVAASTLAALAVPAAQAQSMLTALAMMDDMDNMDNKTGGMGGMGGDNQGMGGMGSGSMASPPGRTMSPPPMRARMGRPGNVDMMGAAGRGMQGMPSVSELPGFPGGSHLYHVGATGFFLDQPQHITLATEQQGALNKVREKWLLDARAFGRRLDEAEQALWTLTAAETPDIAKIEQQVRAIEKMRGDQRIAFIRAVGEAARVLTPEQQAVLLGTKPAAASMSGGMMR